MELSLATIIGRISTKGGLAAACGLGGQGDGLAAHEAGVHLDPGAVHQSTDSGGVDVVTLESRAQCGARGHVDGPWRTAQLNDCYLSHVILHMWFLVSETLRTLDLLITETQTIIKSHRFLPAVL